VELKGRKGEKPEKEGIWGDTKRSKRRWEERCIKDYKEEGKGGGNESLNALVFTERRQTSHALL